VSIISVGLVTFGVVYEHFDTMIIASAASGASYGAFFPCVEGIFADSVPSGRRTFVYNVKYGLETISYVVGYGICIVLFECLGDRWESDTMKIVIYSGLGLQLLSSFVLFAIREKYTLPSHRLLNTLAADQQNSLAQSQSGHLGASSTADPFDASALAKAPGLIPQRWVPRCLVLKDMAVCLGSGMTVMYISLYLIDDYGVSPVGLQGIFMGCSAASVLFSQIVGAVVGDSGKFATADGKPRFNRIRVMMVPYAFAVFGIFYLAFAHGRAAIAALIFAIYVVRSAAINCSSGLSRAVLMDLVPAKNRAKWNIFESVASVSWAGSAIIGGAIADHWDYQATFLITACLHAVALLVLALACFNRDRPPEEIAQSCASAALHPESPTETDRLVHG
jgi:MFS family permease